MLIDKSNGLVFCSLKVDVSSSGDPIKVKVSCECATGVASGFEFFNARMPCIVHIFYTRITTAAQSRKKLLSDLGTKASEEETLSVDEEDAISPGWRTLAILVMSKFVLQVHLLMYDCKFV